MSNSTAGRIFIKGLLFTLPILLTFAILTWAVSGADKLLAKPIAVIVPPAFHFPGIGILISLAIIYLVGLAIHGRAMDVIFRWVQRMMTKLPVVNVVYQNIKEMVDFVSGAKDESLERVVLVEVGDQMRMIGFVTQQRSDIRTASGEQCCAVYLPMSYQMGGYVLYLPEAKLETLEISKREAMQKILTADITSTQGPVPT